MKYASMQERYKNCRLRTLKIAMDRYLRSIKAGSTGKKYVPMKILFMMLSANQNIDKMPYDYLRFDDLPVFIDKDLKTNNRHHYIVYIR